MFIKEDYNQKSKAIIDYIFSLLRDSEENSEWLVSERGIAEQFSIPRRVARETLMDLESRGFLRREPQRGYRLVAFDDTTLETLVRFRFFVENEAGKNAIHKITRQELAEMMILCEDMEKAVANKQLDEMSKLDMAFHKALVKGSHNNMIINVYNILTIPFCPIDEDTDMQTTLESHRLIIQALRDKDQATLEALLRDHVGKMIV